MAQLLNVAHVDGQYQSMDVFDSTQAIVELSAVSIKKTADKQIWLDNDDLIYTVEVRNVDMAVPGDPVSDVVVTDTIDPSIAILIISSLTVTIGDDPTPVVNPDFDYDNITGLLTVRLADLAAGEYATISFHVTKV